MFRLILSGLSIIGEAIKAFFVWKRDEDLRNAGRNENRLDAAERELQRVDEAKNIKDSVRKSSPDDLQRELRG